MPRATVRVVNPKPKRRKPPTPAPNMSKPKRRRRRNTNPSPSRKRRRRNPSRSGGGGGGLNLRSAFHDALPKLVGKLAVAMAVTRFGDATTAGSTGQPSATMGGRWSVTNHLIAGLTSYLAGMLASRMVGRRTGQLVLEGGVDLMLSKALWLELIQRVPGGPAWLGAAPRAHAMMGSSWQALMAQAQPGDIIDDGTGNRYLVGADGRATAMMGAVQLQTATALDGYGMHGAEQLQTATPLDGYAQRMLQAGAMGHLATPPEGYEDAAAYIARGSADPYVAALT